MTIEQKFEILEKEYLPIMVDNIVTDVLYGGVNGAILKLYEETGHLYYGEGVIFNNMFGCFDDYLRHKEKLEFDFRLWSIIKNR